MFNDFLYVLIKNLISGLFGQTYSTVLTYFVFIKRYRTSNHNRPMARSHYLTPLFLRGKMNFPG